MSRRAGAAGADTSRLTELVVNLKVRDIEAIEIAVGAPMTRWDMAPSKVQLLRLVIAALEGSHPDTLADLTLTELAERFEKLDPEV